MMTVKSFDLDSFQKGLKTQVGEFLIHGKGERDNDDTLGYMKSLSGIWFSKKIH